MIIRNLRIENLNVSSNENNFGGLIGSSTNTTIDNVHLFVSNSQSTLFRITTSSNNIGGKKKKWNIKIENSITNNHHFFLIKGWLGLQIQQKSSILRLKISSWISPTIPLLEVIRFFSFKFFYKFLFWWLK